jgi:hypothetical protein
MDISKMDAAVSCCLGRKIDHAVWQYFAGLPDYWHDDVVELLANLFEDVEPDIERMFDEVTGTPWATNLRCT